MKSIENETIIFMVLNVLFIALDQNGGKKTITIGTHCWLRSGKKKLWKKI